MSVQKDFQFSYNWNNKLDCSVFTTLRRSPRWNVGDQGDIFLKNIRKGRGEVVLKIKTTFGGITDGVALLDTGYTADECRNILQRMYKDQVFTNSDHIYLYFIKRVDVQEPPQLTLFNDCTTIL